MDIENYRALSAFRVMEGDYISAEEMRGILANENFALEFWQDLVFGFMLSGKERRFHLGEFSKRLNEGKYAYETYCNMFRTLLQNDATRRRFEADLLSTFCKNCNASDVFIKALLNSGFAESVASFRKIPDFAVAQVVFFVSINNCENLLRNSIAHNNVDALHILLNFISTQETRAVNTSVIMELIADPGNCNHAEKLEWLIKFAKVNIDSHSKLQEESISNYGYLAMHDQKIPAFARLYKRDLPDLYKLLILIFAADELESEAINDCFLASERYFAQGKGRPVLELRFLIGRYYTVIQKHALDLFWHEVVSVYKRSATDGATHESCLKAVDLKAANVLKLLSAQDIIDTLTSMRKQNTTFKSARMTDASKSLALRLLFFCVENMPLTKSQQEILFGFAAELSNDPCMDQRILEVFNV